jgi:hypothetical protein
MEEQSGTLRFLACFGPCLVEGPDAPSVPMEDIRAADNGGLTLLLNDAPQLAFEWQESALTVL